MRQCAAKILKSHTNIFVENLELKQTKKIVLMISLPRLRRLFGLDPEKQK
jgi:hypothetical protein